jgi:hypothetical protein
MATVKKYPKEIEEQIDEAFLEVIANSIAGSPMDDIVKWTNLSQEEIARRLEKKIIK